MTTYVLRGGQLVVKPERGPPPLRDGLATPFVSRIEPYESPIDGREITSWGQRDRELKENGCYDPRDLSPDHKFINRTRRDAGQLTDPAHGQWHDRYDP